MNGYCVVTPTLRRACRVHMFGEFDSDECVALSRSLAQALTTCEVLEIDMTEVEFLGSLALSVLIAIRRTADASDKKMVVIGASRIAKRLLTMTKLADYFGLGSTALADDDTEENVRALASGE